MYMYIYIFFFFKKKKKKKKKVILAHIYINLWNVNFKLLLYFI